MNNIKVFISSTFRDLNQERDYLVQKVFPEIRDELDGITVSEVDLRWGITDEESREKRVIDLCLQYLYESKPFFVGILGERYGSVIAPEDVELSFLVKEAYPLVVEDLKQGLSITEIEIINGVFRAPKDKRPKAIFFVKETTEPSQGEDMKKFRLLQELKRKILAQKDYPVYTYTKLEDLDNLKTYILDSLGKNKDLNNARTNPSTASMIQTCHLKIKTFSEMDGWTDDRSRLLTQLQAVIERAKPVAVLEGIEGVGKSALVARLASTDDANSRRCVFVYGDAPLLPSTNLLMLEYFLNEGRCQLQSEYDRQASRKGWKGWMTRNFKKIDLNIIQNLVEEMAKQKWCFVLDETCSLRLMTISPTRYVLQPIVNAVSFLEKEYNVKINYRILLVQNSGSPYSATSDDYERLVMPMRHSTDGWKYFYAYLNQYSKRLEAEQVRLLKTSQWMVHPRSVSLVCDYMRLYVSHEQMPAFIKRLTTFTTTGDTYHLYLDYLDTILTREQQRRLTGLISIFSCGPTIRHLMDLSGLANIDFHRAWACLSRLTTVSQLGAIRWANDAIGRFVDGIYELNDAAFRQQLARECSRYFLEQIKDLYTPEKLQADLREGLWWTIKSHIISAIAGKCGKNMWELHQMDDWQFLLFMQEKRMFNIDFVRKNLYYQIRDSRIYAISSLNWMQALKKTKITHKEQKGDMDPAFWSEVASEALKGQYNEKFCQWIDRYRQPTVVELTCYLEALREAKLWKQLGVELANPEVLNYVWQTSVVIDCWNVAIRDGGVSIIQPDMKDYDKMLFVSYALRNADGIAYYSQYQTKK